MQVRVDLNDLSHPDDRAPKLSISNRLPENMEERGITSRRIIDMLETERSIAQQLNCTGVRSVESIGIVQLYCMFEHAVKIRDEALLDLVQEKLDCHLQPDQRWSVNSHLYKMDEYLGAHLCTLSKMHWAQQTKRSSRILTYRTR